MIERIEALRIPSVDGGPAENPYDQAGNQMLDAVLVVVREALDEAPKIVTDEFMLEYPDWLKQMGVDDRVKVLRQRPSTYRLLKETP
jgi:hypothetical protein